MSAPDPLRVMRAVDGELSAEEQAAVLADPEARRAAEGLQQLGDVLRVLADERGKSADDIADAVMSRIQAEERRRPAMAPAAARYWPVLAAAAGVALMVGVYTATQAGVPSSPAPVAHHSARLAPEAVQVVPPAPPAALAAAELSPEADVAIESVDFGGKNGTIFLVPGRDQGMTPVVWLVDDPGERGRVEKL